MLTSFGRQHGHSLKANNEIVDQARNYGSHVNTGPFAIPYCLDTLEAVMRAKSINFLNLQKDYSLMKAVAKNIPIQYPPEHNILVVDRIQIPRDLKAEYIAFYDYLKEVFEEMFVNVPRSRVILPRTLSNHSTIQKVYNIYKKRLEKVKFYPTFNMGPHFESLRDDSFVVLCDIGQRQ